MGGYYERELAYVYVLLERRVFVILRIFLPCGLFCIVLHLLLDSGSVHTHRLQLPIKVEFEFRSCKVWS